MIQLNSTFFVPIDKLESATHWLADNYVATLRHAAFGGNVVLGRLLTAVEEDHIGLTVTSRFASEADAETWDASAGVALRQNMAKDLCIAQLLHFNSMIEIIAD